jgi:tetratricopeptide (TPR) repeat protein
MSGLEVSCGFYRVLNSGSGLAMLRLKGRFMTFLTLAYICAWCATGFSSVSVANPRPQAAPGPQGPAKTATARVHLKNGQRALEAGDFPEARAQLELAVRADPELADAYLGLGFLEMQAGNATAAVQRFRKVVELAPGSFQGHYRLAMALLREKKLHEGLQELERAVAIDPRNADALYNLGVVLLESNRPEDALSRLRQARTQGSERPDLAFNLVRAELAAGRTGDARKEAESAAATFGTDAAWRRAVGELFFQYKQPETAAMHLAEAARLEPGSDEIRRRLAAAYLEAGDPARALPLLVTAVGAEDHYLAASAYLAQRRFAEADRESQLALQMEPHDARYLLQSARIDQRIGRHEESLELLRQASQIDPGWAEPYYSAGVTLYLLHRYAEARKSLDRALELEPHSVRCLFLYSAALANQGQNREGEEVLLRAIALDPANARLYYHLGAIRLRDNRAAGAEQAFQKAIQLKPDYAPPHYQLGKLLARADKPEEAVQELEAAVKYQPDLAQAYYQLARVYARLGRQEESDHALSTFNEFKKQEESPDIEFTDAVQRELQTPDSQHEP